MVITTHDDDVNVYLAIYCRRLRPDIAIVARANLDRNVSTLYRAGADAVLVVRVDRSDRHLEPLPRERHPGRGRRASTCSGDRCLRCWRVVR